ncbi:glycosyltransferase family 2 protein [Paenibacillus elgii]|uniref:glycosyltransferase family 2 protein n=1 Tax=Paenibacillus elgii TaxID=189691 RepID=UPI0013D511E6|nr:glycosyltransferase [Paenibacillus elgii]
MEDTQKPLISVVVPSYNYSKFIERCLYSIFNQSYPNLELIIVDDCSKDQSVQIISRIINAEEFKSRFHGRIQLHVNQHNKGAHNAINFGLSLAQGEYLTIINADDLYEENRFVEIISQMQMNERDIAFSRVKVIDENDESISKENQEAQHFNSLQDNIANFPTVGFSMVPHNVAISTGNMVFKKSLYQSIGKFKNLRYCHDWDFILRATLVTEPIYITSTYYCYRLHGNNTFRSLSKIMNREVATVLGAFFKEVRKGKFSNNVTFSKLNYPEIFQRVIVNCNLQSFWDFSKSPMNVLLQLRQKVLDKY